MRPSPLQLNQHHFSKVLVEINKEYPKIEEVKLWEKSADFSGVSFSVHLEAGLAEGQENDPEDYVVKLNLLIENKVGKPLPYNLDVEVTGYFKLQKIYPPAEREDIAIVNGASLLYGTIREMVASLTARSAPGPLQLPSMNFRDHASDQKEKGRVTTKRVKEISPPNSSDTKTAAAAK